MKYLNTSQKPTKTTSTAAVCFKIESITILQNLESSCYAHVKPLLKKKSRLVSIAQKRMRKETFLHECIARLFKLVKGICCTLRG